MTNAHDIACIEIVEVVTEYLEGAMPADERRRFEAHLEQCPFCTEYVEQMRAVGRGLGDVDAETITPERREALVEAFRGWRNDRA